MVIDRLTRKQLRDLGEVRVTATGAGRVMDVVTERIPVKRTRTVTLRPARR